MYLDVNSGPGLTYSRSINKLDDQFNLLSVLPVPCSTVCRDEDLPIGVGYRDCIAVGDNGYVYLQNYSISANGVATEIGVYDSNLSFVRQNLFDKVVSIRRISGETIMAFPHLLQQGKEHHAGSCHGKKRHHRHNRLHPVPE